MAKGTVTKASVEASSRKIFKEQNWWTSFLREREGVCVYASKSQKVYQGLLFQNKKTRVIDSNCSDYCHTLQSFENGENGENGEVWRGQVP